MGLFIEGPEHWTSPICRRVWENFLTEWIFWLQVGRASPRKCFRSVKIMGYHHDYRSMDATTWLANDHRLVKWSSSPKWWHATYDLGNNVPIRLTILVLSKFQVIFGNVDCSPADILWTPGVGLSHLAIPMNQWKHQKKNFTHNNTAMFLLLFGDFPGKLILSHRFFAGSPRLPPGPGVP